MKKLPASRQLSIINGDLAGDWFWVIPITFSGRLQTGESEQMWAADGVVDGGVGFDNDRPFREYQQVY